MSEKYKVHDLDVDSAIFDMSARLNMLPTATAVGLLKGFSAALAVAERHAEDKGEKWLEQTMGTHVEHAYQHLAYRRFEEPDDDGLPHGHHACCRLLFAVAKREGM